MLAPMQGVTNRAVRKVFAQWVRPDVLFTEFMRVKGERGARAIEGDVVDGHVETQPALPPPRRGRPVERHGEAGAARVRDGALRR